VFLMGKIEDVFLEYQSTGPCTVDVDLLEKKWNHLWWISEYDGGFRLIKNLRRRCASTTVKVTITKEQAEEIIDRMNLERCADPLFVKAASWRRDGDFEILTQKL